MASTTALFTGLTGLNANARNLDVIGNNIANVNTTAYKSNRLMFSTAFSRTFSLGSSPAVTSGGTNPGQIGLGVNVAGTQRNMGGGALSPTGDMRDMAIDGAGMFVVERGAGDQFFTRAGSFRPNRDNVLTTISGERLQGYGVDEEFNIVPGRLVDVTIPTGNMTLAEATANVRFAGNLNANGDLPTRGSLVELRGTSSAGLVAIATAVPAPTAPNLIEGTTRLLDVEDPLLAGSGTPLFSLGQQFEVRNAERGGKLIPPQSLAIDAATTIDDLSAFLTQALGIDTTSGNNPDGSTPGVTIDPLTGVVSIVGNAGAANNLVVDNTDLRLLDAAGSLVRYPLHTTQSGEADGESVRTTVVVFDSLGTPLEMDLTFVLDSRSNTGTTWRYFAQSPDDTDASSFLGTGLLSFDPQGQLVTTTPVSVLIDREATGAATPLTISLSFTDGAGGLTALTDETSELAAVFRDGAPRGTLSGFAVGPDGIITGSFTNGRTRTIGQIALATFANHEGLIDAGGNLFSVGANSGPAVITEPGLLGAGRVIGGALELSNVDLGEEFIKMILSSTGYSASSRVIRTTDELMQQLLVIGR
ncbi:MAG: flagellar hook-basal body complex protein [Phycisphaerales bacterium]|nr:flagellar hook-basal body complex protein [Phycisphaerales bacterium]